LCSCFFLSFGFGLKSENPRLTGNRGFFEKLFFKSELHLHDARMPADARPNGQASIGLRVLPHWGKRVFHVQSHTKNTIRAGLSNVFIIESSFSQGLSDKEVVLN
jgi:hypothetical protein